MAHTLVKDIMNQDLISLNSNQTIKEAASKMDENNIGCIIVTKENNPLELLQKEILLEELQQKKYYQHL